jgi:hypothetical protein
MFEHIVHLQSLHINWGATEIGITNGNTPDGRDHAGHTATSYRGTEGTGASSIYAYEGEREKELESERRLLACMHVAPIIIRMMTQISNTLQLLRGTFGFAELHNIHLTCLS